MRNGMRVFIILEARPIKPSNVVTNANAWYTGNVNTPRTVTGTINLLIIFNINIYLN